ncbi:MAG TPA: arginine deiminase family protein [Arenimonas sp.]|nr:arginine deiminase family protein [Arenimonas sp.]
MTSIHALCRAVSPAIADCELSFIGREPINVAMAHLQHIDYVDLLNKLGAKVIELPAEPALPDSVFVEDTALLFDELAVMTRPGALSRRAEVASIEAAFRKYREIIAHITEPGTLDGGDVLRIGKRVFVGLSARSNQAAIDQLAGILAPYGYSVTAVPMHDCLHLKSSVTALSDDTVLINPEWVDAGYFKDYRQILVAESEPHAANVVRIHADILMPSNFPETQALVQAAGFTVHTVDVAELQKAEGAVTCCSVLFKA